MTTANDQNITLSKIVCRKVWLERRTSSRFLGLCPFHEERTPSFMVDDSAGSFHCFGCRAHGDAFDFVLRTEPLLFQALIERLVQSPHLFAEAGEMAEAAHG